VGPADSRYPVRHWKENPEMLEQRGRTGDNKSGTAEHSALSLREAKRFSFSPRDAISRLIFAEKLFGGNGQ